MTSSRAGNVLNHLSHLKLTQLQKLAVSLGTSCSGTKAAIKCSIEQSLPKAGDIPSTRPLSLISIDMGIRNLAYAHFTSGSAMENTNSLRYGTPRLCAWEKIAVSSPSPALPSLPTPSLKTTPQPSTSTNKPVRESFSPALYARHAVTLLTHIISSHNPTHILIERQRFRSGGSPIVQDWSIRVGVFEGMLYAILRTLRERCAVEIHVEGVETKRVNGFWVKQGLGVGALPKGKALKKMKIDLAGRVLEGSLGGSKTRLDGLEIDNSAMHMVDAYLAKWTKGDRSISLANKGVHEDKGSLPELSKLDDLADCLLQGMAWMEWQQIRARVAASEDVEALLSL